MHADKNAPDINTGRIIKIFILSQFAPAFMFSGVAVALPSMGHELGASAVQLGLVETLFLASQLALLLPIGQLSDVMDKKALYKMALLAFGLSSLLIASLSSIHTILFLRVLQGLASATFSTTGLAIVSDMVSPAKRGRVFGSAIGALYAGLTLGPLCAGFLVDLWNWRAVFCAGGVLVLLAYALQHATLISKWKLPDNTFIHYPSALLMLVATGFLVAGSALIHHGILGYTCIALALVLTALFIKVQKKITNPLLDINTITQNKALARALLMQVLLYVNAYASVFMLSLYAQISLGFTAQTAGYALAGGAVVMVFMAPLAGRLADKFNPKKIICLGVGSVLLATLIALTLTQNTPLWFVTLVLGVQSFGFALFSSPNMMLIMHAVPAKLSGTASALAAKARSLGMVMGMILTGALISRTIGTGDMADHPDTLLKVMQHMYLLLMCSTALSLFIGLKDLLARPR